MPLMHFHASNTGIQATNLELTWVGSKIARPARDKLCLAPLIIKPGSHEAGTAHACSRQPRPCHFPFMPVLDHQAWAMNHCNNNECT